MSKIRTNTFTGRSATPVALAVLAVLAAAPVAAQEEAAGSMLEEIVVTAQKRSQNIQEVPVAVSYVAGDTIEARGGLNAEALKTLVPSLNVRKTNTTINQALFLRGVGTINFAIAAQPSVAAVLDGVVLSSAGEAFGDLYDVERVEVLRGPQGTLFGKNSSAGVVNIISKRPGDAFAGYVDLGWYEDDEMRVKASLDTPLSSTVKGRTTVNWGQYDGYIDNISTTAAGGKLNGYDHKGIRTLWVVAPSDDVELTFIGDYRKADDNCCAEIIGTAPTGTNGAALNSLLSGVDFLGIDTREIKQNLQMRSEEEAWGLSVQADIGLSGDRTLTSITAYRTWDSTEIREGDWLDRAAAYVGNAFAQLHDYGPQDTDTISQELRIASPGGEKVDYVAGVYFSKTQAHRFFERSVTSCTASTLPADATGVAPCTAAASTIVSASSSADFGADFKTLAAFADATVNLQERMRVIAGIRWTQDDLSYFHNRTPSPIAGLPGIRTDTTGFTGENSSSNWSGRLGLQFGLTDDIMLYTTYARGYKGPAYNVFFNMVANDKQVIDAETANAYEVGLKTTLFDGKLLFNSALFYAEYDNFQANNYLLLNGVVITTLTNAGKVQTEGLELDFLARPTDNLSISGGWTYTDAHVAQFFTPPGQAVRVRNGTALPLAPTYKGSLAIDYRIPLGSFDLVPNLAYSHQSLSWADLNQPSALKIQGYETFDLSLTFATKDDRYRLMLVGRNVFDESSAAMATAGGPGGSPRLQIPRDADRYFGAQFRAQFGGK